MEYSGLKKIDPVYVSAPMGKAIVLNLLGFTYLGIAQVESGLTLVGSKSTFVNFSELSGPVEVSTSLLGGPIIVVSLKNGKQFRVDGLRWDDARKFVYASGEFYRQYVQSLYMPVENEVGDLVNHIDQLRQPSYYPAACLVSPIVKRAVKVSETLPTNIPESTLSDNKMDSLTKVIEFSKSFHQIRNIATKAFLDKELEDMADFFDSIESYPLTLEQRRAVVTDEDATLVLAGAGSGKTSVIVSKAAYLARKNICEEEEILLLAFGRDAAGEMVERIRRKSGIEIEALTFHALGYKIIREVDGCGPPLAEHASDKFKRRKLLRDILINELSQQEALKKMLMEWFSELFYPDRSEWDFESDKEYKDWVRRVELRTYNGDLVKSYEELVISNWLYRNGIDHQYEPRYDGQLPKDARGAYKPDFRLTESGVYIEHFGVRKKAHLDGSVTLETAPYIDKEEYLDQMDWKRQVHQCNGTILIETFSYEKEENRLLDALQEKLHDYDIIPQPIPENQIFEKLSEMGLTDSFSRTLGDFLCLFKSSNLSIAHCYTKPIRHEQEKRRIHAFLQIFEAFLEAYQERLGECIDFEDMVNQASMYVEEGRYRSLYKYILVDEFQDISEGRARLLRALLDQRKNARLFSVGDDWQSILRFTGSDINLMYDFGKQFGGSLGAKEDIHRIVNLRHNFRSVDKIAHPSRHFILQNESQIKKEVATQSTSDSPAIRVVYDDSESTLQRILEDISNKTSGITSVMVIARYKFLEPNNMGLLSSKFSNISPLSFKTAHASKGLESDHVIILEMVSGKYGFPSNISDDPVLDLVLSKSELHPYAEERRVFYVALSRARKSVTILSNRASHSVFVKELVDDPQYKIEVINNQSAAGIRCETCGGHVLRKVSRDNRIYFECEYKRWCAERIQPCSECKRDIPVLAHPRDSAMRCSCGAEFEACPKCKNGWLAECQGRHGKFLGCTRYPACRGSKSINYIV